MQSAGYNDDKWVNNQADNKFKRFADQNSKISESRIWKNVIFDQKFV